MERKKSMLSYLEPDREWVKFFGAGCGLIAAIIFMNFFLVAFDQPSKTMTMDINSAGEADIEFIIIWPFVAMCLYGFVLQWQDYRKTLDGKGRTGNADASGRVIGQPTTLPPTSDGLDSPLSAGGGGEITHPTLPSRHSVHGNELGELRGLIEDMRAFERRTGRRHIWVGGHHFFEDVKTGERICIDQEYFRAMEERIREEEEKRDKDDVN